LLSRCVLKVVCEALKYGSRFPFRFSSAAQFNLPYYPSYLDCVEFCAQSKEEVRWFFPLCPYGQIRNAEPQESTGKRFFCELLI